MTLRPGVHLGAFEILGPLGAGGMGEVYRARDLRLGREVAVKVLPAEVASSPERLARFGREARAVAALNHPNIVALFSVEDGAGVRFLAMELVEGRTLSSLVAPEGLSLPRIIEIAIPLADALAAAHERGVVHRDLKPGNVMVTRDARVKVLDFGLAKLARPDAASNPAEAPTEEAPVSLPGGVAGTVPYMAPEQLRGEPVDARADLFALGVILYELACGRRPFGGKTNPEVASAILRDPPRPFRAAGIAGNGEFERLVLRCLEKNPGGRFQSAREVGEALQRLRRELEESAAAPAVRAGSAAPSIAVLPFANMSADPENEFFSDGLSEELLNVLAKSPDLKVTGRTSAFAFKGKQEDLRSIGQKLGVGTLLEGSVRKAGNRVRITAQLIKAADGFHLWSESYDRVLDDIFAVQDEIARSVSAALHVTLLGKPAVSSKASAGCFERILRANQLVLQITGPAVSRAVLLYREVIEECPDDARAWTGLARALAWQAYYGYADVGESHRGARKAVERALALDDTLADAHEVLGAILATLELRLPEAIEEVERARALAPNASGPMTALGVYRCVTGRFEEALPLVRRATEIDPLNPRVHAQHGAVASASSDLEEACEAYQAALELSPGMTLGHSSLGLLFLRRGMGERAIAEIQREPSVAFREEALAIAHHALGNRQESDAALARLLHESEQWAFQFAAAHACRGEIDRAFHWLDRAYEVHDTGLIWTKVIWLLWNLHSDPRWPAYLAKIGLG